jgi:hypothetical protein
MFGMWKTPMRSAAIKGLSLEASFWLRVWPCGDCWEWRGAISDNGYGTFNIPSCTDMGGLLAHRLAYELAIGPIPMNTEIDHLCRNRWCIRPSHLEVVSRRDNVLRSWAPTARLHRLGKCKRGHLLSEGYQRKDTGAKMCRVCKRIRERKRYPQIKGILNARRRLRRHR